MDSWIFRNCGILRIYGLRSLSFLRFADLRFVDPIIFADLKLTQMHTVIFLLTNTSFKCSHSNLRTISAYGTVFLSIVFRSLTILP